MTSAQWQEHPMATADTYPHVILNADGEAFIEGTRYTIKHIAAE